MNDQLNGHWWAFVLRGLAAIAVAVIAFLRPDITLATLILLFGAFALVDGAFAVVGALRAPSTHRLTMLLGGFVGIAIGLVTMLAPGLTALALLTVIGVWAIFLGGIEIVAAYRLRKVVDREWLLVISGALSIVFGAYVLLFPGAGALTIVWLIGWYLLVIGVMLIGVGLRLRQRRPAIG
jgi:uncharacterized membrane protein HdeD (DUF308 family)